MDIDQLPKCLCIADAPNPIERTSWKGHGGSFSPMGTDRHYKCDLCTRQSIEIYRPGGNLFIINATQADLDYINVTMDRIWRDRETAIRRWRDASWFGHVSRTLGRIVKSDEDLKDWPLEERRATYAVYEGVILEQYGQDAHNVIPDELRLWPMPAGCPLDWTGRTFVFQKLDAGWTPVDAAACQEAQIPEDPRRVSTLAFFEKVWERVAQATGDDVRPRLSEIPNGYWKDPGKSEPWFQFGQKGRTFRIGWRKRVVNIEVKADKNLASFDPRPVSALALKDETTLYVDGDRRPSSQAANAEDVTVHAWTQDKVVEYLTAMFAS